jgi:hypothetical protein
MMFIMMMGAVRTSETSVDNQFTRQYNPEDSSERDIDKFHETYQVAQNMSIGPLYLKPTTALGRLCPKQLGYHRYHGCSKQTTFLPWCINNPWLTLLPTINNLLAQYLNQNYPTPKSQGPSAKEILTCGFMSQTSTQTKLF